jgi:hypothetical protein
VDGAYEGEYVGAVEGQNEGAYEGAVEGDYEGEYVGAVEGEYVGAYMISVVDGNAVGSKYVTDLFIKSLINIQEIVKYIKIVKYIRGDQNRCDRISGECIRSYATNRPEEI